MVIALAKPWPSPDLQRVTASLALHDLQGIVILIVTVIVTVIIIINTFFRPLANSESAEELLVGTGQQVVLEYGRAPVAVH